MQWSIVVEFEKIGSVIYKLLFSLQGCREGIFLFWADRGRGGFFSRPYLLGIGCTLRLLNMIGLVNGISIRAD